MKLKFLYNWKETFCSYSRVNSTRIVKLGPVLCAVNRALYVNMDGTGGNTVDCFQVQNTVSDSLQTIK